MQNALSPDSPIQTLVGDCIATWTRVQHKVVLTFCINSTRA